MLVLGIETSCDETAAAVVRDGREIISSVIASQIATHKRFGGVVPELASREHLDKIVPIVEEAFARADYQRRDRWDCSDYWTWPDRFSAGRCVICKGNGLCAEQAAGRRQSHRRPHLFCLF